MLKQVSKLVSTVCLCCLLSAVGVGQTITPPIAEYRGKAQGMFELRNDGDVPLAGIVELQGFTVDQEGNLTYQPISDSIKVEMGTNSFVIPAHQSHMVFYKVSTAKPYAWFTVLSTLTKAASDRTQMRINFVLPHIVYLYQKQKLKKEDVSVTVSRGAKEGEYSVQVQNQSDKLGRVENVSWKGFENSNESGGFPVFPQATRRVTLETGAVKKNATVKVNFQDGFSVEVPVQ